MAFFSDYKSTVFIWFLIFSACGSPQKKEKTTTDIAESKEKTTSQKPIIVAANQTKKYLPLLKGQSVGIVANQTSVIFRQESRDEKTYVHLVDSLLALKINIKKVFAPEHGFRGQADAGEKVKDDVDLKTGLPLISLHGKTRKPSAEQLKGLDVVLFDIQDVGVRFYTYIATLQLVMEACAENNIPIVVLDRPNPNAHYVDGPSMETEHTSFLGMTEIPLVYGMTIGEYGKMINEEGWLTDGIKANLTIIPLQNWTRSTPYHLTIRPSPNLPNDQAINLYPSLGLFEGTNSNAGRGTESQFQRYGASFLDSTQYSFSYTPRPNFGSKNPKEKGKICYGKDLSEISKMSEVSLQWIIDAYKNSTDTSKFFNTSGFTKHAGTEKLQKQIESGLSEKEIKATWQTDLEKFQKVREKYLIYN
ncbi:MAG: exo-beta-N-acetylmuramidase NamZ domain-containing protein [Maribacter sp.]